VKLGCDPEAAFFSGVLCERTLVAGYQGGSFAAPSGVKRRRECQRSASDLIVVRRAIRSAWPDLAVSDIRKALRHTVVTVVGVSRSSAAPRSADRHWLMAARAWNPPWRDRWLSRFTERFVIDANRGLRSGSRLGIRRETSIRMAPLCDKRLAREVLALIEK
jgi:hypothetical protein